MKLTPQQKQIVDFLSDGKWHCMAGEMFMKDDRKRISELKTLGYNILGERCRGLCGKSHSSRVFMRRLMDKPANLPERLIYHPVMKKWLTAAEYRLV